MSSATIPVSPRSNPSSQPMTSDKKNQKKKPTRRPRRRGGADSESENEGDSDHSVSSVSSLGSENDSEEEDEDAPESSKPKSAFVDASSTTPAACQDGNAPTEEIGFDAFNRGEGGLAIRDSAKRGRGGAVPALVGDRKERKPLTPDQLKKLEEKRARQKEKLKLKRKEAKEAKRKQKEDEKGDSKPADQPKELRASTSGVKIEPESSAKGKEKSVGKKAKGKGKQKDDVNPETLTTDTAALTINDDPAATSSDPSIAPAACWAAEPFPEDQHQRPPTGPRNGRRPASNDPKITPRAGGFWTHDQRHEAFNDSRASRGSFRGRGSDRGGFRGGFRGRGGGPLVSTYGGPPFPHRGAGRGQELTETLAGDDKKDGEEKTLEMDKLEAQLEKQKEAARERKEEAEVKDVEPVEGEEAKEVKPVQPRQSKWGHEGFESMQAVAHFQANRMLRGRGRGRGFFGEEMRNGKMVKLIPGAGRGGFVPRPPFHNLPTPDKTPDATGASLPVQTATQPTTSNASETTTQTEATSTGPTADTLLEEEPVTVKIPRAEATAAESTPQYNSISRPSSSAASTTIRASAPAFAQPKPLLAQAVPPVFSDGTASPQPFPANGSENGSVASAGHLNGPAYIANAVAPEFYPANGMPAGYRQSIHDQRPPAFYPPQHRFAPQPQAAPFYPQSYSPDLYNHPTRHASFSSSGFVDPRSASPYPYVQQQNGSGYFMPPRSNSKVSIKAPLTDEKEGEEGLKRYASIDQSVNPAIPGGMGMDGQAYYARHYNPYAVPPTVYGGAWQGGEGYVNGPAWGYGY